MAVLMRMPDWPERLDAVLSAARHRPFRWGVHDCALFTADAVEAMTGIDPAAAWRGRYGSARSAIALRWRTGLFSWSQLFAEAAERWHLPRIAPLHAHRGDVVCLDLPTGRPAGICIGARIASPAKDGLVFLPRTLARAAWHVPFPGET